jgi:outer membrane protein TolC
MKIEKWFHKKALTLTAMLILGIMAPAMAAENQEALSLKQIVDITLQNNPTLLESQKRWEEKMGRIPVATAWPNPKFGIMKDDIANGLLSPGTAMMTEYSVTQEIMNPSKLKSMGKMASSDGLMAKANYLDKRMEVYSTAKQTYYDLLYASKALEIGKENQQLMGQLVQIAQVNYSTGMVSLQDTLRAQTEFSKMTTDLLNMAAMEAVTKAQLNTMMNRSADTALTVKEEFSAPPPNFDLAGLKQQAIDGKPAVISMQRQVEMAQAGVEVAKKQKLPDYEVQLAYKDYQEQPNTWKIGVMAMLPIWQDKNQGQIKSAAANLDAAKASLNNMQNMTALDIQMALTEAQTAWRKIDLYQNTIIPEAEQTYQAGVVSYTNGKVDFMAVLDSLNALRNAKLDYYKARIDYEKAAANLEKAVGKPLFTSGLEP